MSIDPRPPANASPLEIRIWKAEWRLTVIEESLVEHGISAATHPSLREQGPETQAPETEPLEETFPDSIAEAPALAKPPEGAMEDPPAPAELAAPIEATQVEATLRATPQEHHTPGEEQQPATEHESPPRHEPATNAAVSEGAATPEHSEPGAAAAATNIPSSSIQWEQWVGVRGAAVLGGAVLALATIYLFKFTIDKGLITPSVRLLLGGLTSLGAIGLSETIVRKKLPPLADPLAGAGITGAYATLWAGTSLLGLLSPAVSFVGMAMITVVAGLLSVRHRSLIIAAIGLTGGFLTPVLVSTGDPRPLVLFIYLFLLNIGVLVVSRRQGWVVLPMLAFLLTGAYQLLFVGLQMSAGWNWLGFATTGGFAALFAMAPLPAFADPESETQRVGEVLFRGSALLFSFMLTALLSPTAHASIPFEGTAALLLILLGGAHVLATVHRQAPFAGLFTVAAAALTGLQLSIWSAGTSEPSPNMVVWAIEATAMLVFISVVPLIRAVVLRRQESPIANLWSFWLSALVAGFFFVYSAVFKTFPEVMYLSGAAGILALAWTTLFGLRPALATSSSLTREPALALMITTAFPFGFVVLYEVWGGGLMAQIALGIAVLANAATVLLARRLTPESGEADVHGYRGAEHGVALGLLASCLPFLITQPTPVSFVLLLAWCGLAIGVAVSPNAPRHGSLQLRWQQPWQTMVSVEQVTPLLTIPLLLALLLSVFAVSLHGPLRTSRLAAWIASACTVLFYVPLLFAFGESGWFGFLEDKQSQALLAMLLALLPGAAAVLTRRRSQQGELHASAQLAAYVTAFCALFTLACFIALPSHWFAVALILEGVVLMASSGSLGLRSPTTELAGAALSLAGCFGLLAQLVGEIRSIAYVDFLVSYGVATLMLGAGSYVVAQRLKASPDDNLWGWSNAIVHFLLGASMLLGFGLITEGVLRAFPGQTGPGPDLAISLTWAVYALMLLALGMISGRRFPRAVSLALLLFTCGKVFIYDLAYLKDLYRVASLAGLAFALMGYP